MMQISYLTLHHLNPRVPLPLRLPASLLFNLLQSLTSHPPSTLGDGQRLVPMPRDFPSPVVVITAMLPPNFSHFTLTIPQQIHHLFTLINHMVQLLIIINHQQLLPPTLKTSNVVWQRLTIVTHLHQSPLIHPFAQGNHHPPLKMIK